MTLSNTCSELGELKRNCISHTHTLTDTQRSTHLVRTDGAEGFLSRVRGQGKRVDFGQTRLYVKLNTHARTCTQTQNSHARHMRRRHKWSECHADSRAFTQHTVWINVSLSCPTTKLHLCCPKNVWLT